MCQFVYYAHTDCLWCPKGATEQNATCITNDMQWPSSRGEAQQRQQQHSEDILILYVQGTPSCSFSCRNIDLNTRWEHRLRWLRWSQLYKSPQSTVYSRHSKWLWGWIQYRVFTSLIIRIKIITSASYGVVLSAHESCGQGKNNDDSGQPGPRGSPRFVTLASYWYSFSLMVLRISSGAWA